jgi:hypothetical protein
MILAVARLQILDDVSNLIQTRMRDRLRLTTTGRPTIPRFRAPGDRRWLASNECDVCVCVWSPVLRGSFVYTASWRPQLFPIAPHITGAFHRMPAEPIALTASQGVLTPNSSNQRQFILFRQVSVRKHDGQRR